MTQRYDLVTNYRCGDAIEEMERADDGEWMRFDDAATAMESLYRELLSVSLTQQHAALQRIAALERQLAAAREEIRRYVAERMEE